MRGPTSLQSFEGMDSMDAGSTRGLRRGVFGARRSRCLALLGATFVVALAGLLVMSGVAAAATCTIYWTGKTSTSWSAATNWSLTNGGTSAGRVPTTTDYVCMSTSASNTAVDLKSSTTTTIAGINWPQAGTLSPSLEDEGKLTVGTKTAAEASTLNQLNLQGTLVLYKGEAASVGNLTLDGTLEGPGKLTVSGPATLGDGGDVFLGEDGTSGTQADLVLQGATTVDSGYAYFSEGSEIENQGTLTLQDGAGLYNYDGNTANKLVNDSAATVSYIGSSSSESATVEVPAVNNGTVSVGEGTLNFGQSGTTSETDSGTFTAAAGTTLDLGGTRTEASGATIGGAGEVDITGTAMFTAAANLTSTGAFEVSGALAIASGVNVSTSNLTLDGTLEGPGKLTVTGPATLDNGAMLGDYGISGTQAGLVLQGATTVDSGTVYFAAGSEIENQGTLTLQDNADLYNYDGNAANELVNDSSATVTYTGSNSSQSATVGVAAVNNGTVAVHDGTLSFGGGTGSGADSGTFTAAAGTTLDLGGTRTEASGATIGGAGEVDITGTATFTAAANLASTGTFEVSGALAIASGVNVSTSNLTLDGTLEGPGKLTVTGPAMLGDGGDVFLGLDGTAGTQADLVLQGATTVSGTVYFAEGSEIENEGALTLQDNTDLYNYDGNTANELVNDSGGTVAYTGSTSSESATVGVPAVNNGTVSVGRGTLLFGGGTGSGADSGTFTTAAGATVNLGGTTMLTSTLNVTGAGTFEISGTADVGSGVAVSVGNLTLDGALEGPGKLTVTGPATLGSGATLGQYETSGTQADLVLQGATTVDSNYVYFAAGSEIENQGTLTLQNEAYLYNWDSNAANELVNDSGGTVSYTGSSSSESATVEVAAVNNGTVSVGEGTLSFGGGTGSGVDSGTFTTAAGATVNLGGTTMLTSTLNVTGAGTFKVSGTASVASGVAVSVGNLTLDGALEGPGKLTVTGPATLGSGATLGQYETSGTQADLVLQGATTVDSNYVYFAAGSEIENQGTLTLQNEAYLYNWDSNAANELVNDSGGTVSYTGSTSSQSATVNVTFSNAGTVSANKGTLSLPDLSNLSGGTLTGGTYDTAGGTLSLASGVTTNAATISLGVSPSKILTGTTNALGTLASNSGSLSLNQSLSTSASFSTSGSVTVQSGTFSTHSFTQTAGTTTVVGTAILQSGSGSGSVAVNGGTLTGTGEIKGNLLGTGNVAPVGTVTGPMKVTGTYNDSAGTLTIPVSGASTAGTEYGQLSAAGAATLGGTLHFSTASGYSPPIGTQYTILEAASISGTFANVTGAQLPSEQYVVSYTATSVIATVQAVPPTVTEVAPAKGPTTGGTEVTITGANLKEATSVKFGGTNATSFTVNSATSITAFSPAGTGTVEVTVTTPGGTSAASSADHFEYVPAPTVTEVSPTKGPVAGGTTVTITGTNFTGAKEVKFGLVEAKGFTVNSATSITAESSAGSAGTTNVTVTTVGGESAVSSADDFTYVAAPTVTEVSPAKGPTAGGTTVTIAGANLSEATAVKFGSTSATGVTVNSPTSITAVSPAGTAGIVDVTVTTPGGTSATSSADHFEYTSAPAPTVTKVSPTKGSAAGGTKVTITGTNLSGATTVKFGSASATGVTVKSATSITAVSPAGTVGTVDVTVTTPGGTSATSSKDHFEYTPVPPPTVTKLSPTKGPVAGGTKVTITGTNLSEVTAVKFGSASGTSITVKSATSITVISPAGTAGVVDVTVTTPSGTSATSSADHFEYTPTITKLTPSTGSAAGGTVVVVKGTGFAVGKTLTTFVFGTTTATSVECTSTTECTVVAPAHAEGKVEVVATVNAESSPKVSADQFTYS